MPTQPCSDLRSWACQGLLVALVAASACNEPEPPTPSPESTPAPPVGPATLVVELPAGVEVSIDGAERRPAPIAALEVEPGEHTLTLVTACQELKLRIDAPAGETTRVDRERAEGLRLTTLEITARDLDGKPLAHTVLLDERVVTSGEGSSKITVPACKHRMKVSSEGLGAFIEDIDLGVEAIVREVVLAPGPDMVRIHGGPFTLGPPESSVRTEVRWDTLIPRKDVVLATFDMDKTEVTAAQFHECRVSGRCAWDWGRDIGLEKWPRFPPDDERRHCTTSDYNGLRKPVAGREDHPMNCVSYHEAEMYCAANGKRLTTAAEWEYAARSRNPEYYCPWAPPSDVSKENPVCKRELVKGRGIQAGCLEPDRDTEQGICDMLWNVAEHVSHEHITSAYRDGDVTTRGSYNDCDIEGCGLDEYDEDDRAITFDHSTPRSGFRGSSYRSGPNDQDVRIGFRCARDAMNQRNK